MMIKGNLTLTFCMLKCKLTLMCQWQDQLIWLKRKLVLGMKFATKVIVNGHDFCTLVMFKSCPDKKAKYKAFPWIVCNVLCDIKLNAKKKQSGINKFT